MMAMCSLPLCRGQAVQETEGLLDDWGPAPGARISKNQPRGFWPSHHLQPPGEKARFRSWGSTQIPLFNSHHQFKCYICYLTLTVFVAFNKICCRCGAEYKVNANGNCVRKEECSFHWGQLRRQKGLMVPVTILSWLNPMWSSSSPHLLPDPVR